MPISEYHVEKKPGMQFVLFIIVDCTASSTVIGDADLKVEDIVFFKEARVVFLEHIQLSLPRLHIRERCCVAQIERAIALRRMQKIFYQLRSPKVLI